MNSMNRTLALSLTVASMAVACNDLDGGLLDPVEVSSANMADPTQRGYDGLQDRDRSDSRADDNTPTAWVELRWDSAGEPNNVNLDLHVKDPNGSHIYYLNTSSEDDSGMFAPHRECVSFDCDGSESSPSERIHWDIPEMPKGTYEVWVTNDSEQSGSFELELHVPGTEAVESGSVAGGGTSSTFVFEIEEEPNDCIGKLRSRGVQFSEITISEGSCKVEDAVMVSGPVNGITYRYDPSRSTTRLRTSCEVALKLYDSAALLKQHNIDTVYHKGSYACRNKRRVSGLSQHAYARAMDYAGFRTTGGTEYSVVRHWEHNTTSPRTDEGRILRTIATGLKSYYPIVLDADHDSDHDDHFHGALRGH